VDIKVETHNQIVGKDSLEGLGGPITRANAKRTHKALYHMIINMLGAQLHNATHSMEARWERG